MGTRWTRAPWWVRIAHGGNRALRKSGRQFPEHRIGYEADDWMTCALPPTGRPQIRGLPGPSSRIDHHPPAFTSKQSQKVSGRKFKRPKCFRRVAHTGVPSALRAL